MAGISQSPSIRPAGSTMARITSGVITLSPCWASRCRTSVYLAELREDGVSYIFAGPKGDDLALAMEQLGTVFGVKTLLLEGGGAINGSFLKRRLIDEFSTLIYPAVDGLAGVQSIVDYHGTEDERPGAGQALRLIGCETLEGGMVWLRHKVEDAPAPTP
jgi:riboflavin biosynthesis pyrimidine reductase